MGVISPLRLQKNVITVEVISTEHLQQSQIDYINKKGLAVKSTIQVNNGNVLEKKEEGNFH